MNFIKLTNVLDHLGSVLVRVEEIASVELRNAGGTLVLLRGTNEDGYHSLLVSESPEKVGELISASQQVVFS